MNIFYIVVFTSYLIGCFFLRKIIKKVFLAPFDMENFTFLFDIFFVSFIAMNILKRKGVFPTDFGSHFVMYGFLFWGISWVLLLCFALHFFLEKRKVGSPQRRKFFKKSISVVGSISAVTLALKGKQQAFEPIIIKQNVALPPKFKSLQGLSITQISDLHIGPILDGEFAQKVVSMSNELNSDIVVITGDIADAKAHEIREQMSCLKDLTSKYGVYYILGNHEYYWGAQGWIELMQDFGLTTLVDQHKELEVNQQKVVIAGVTDKTAKRMKINHSFDPKEAFRDSDQDAFRILLAHRPKVCFQAEDLNVHLQLSGHTHGGQAFPWNLAIGLVQPYLKGLHNHKGCQLYVNRGTGFWGPANRLMNSGEITKITFT